ncbi:MAG: response regulator [Lachnospiraceae bacterium]|nr:response regulator [Lachnospiraceae bacterium]
MGKRKYSFSDIISRIDIRRFVVSVVISVLFLTLIVFYNIFLNNETKKGIVVSGELNAYKYAEDFDECLMPGMSALKISAQVMNKAIRDHDSKETMIYYLETGTESIMDSLVKNTTGLYACIDGEYLDGAGWQPDDDYIAAERPWYTETDKTPGKITIIEPYLDAMSGKVIITLVECLEDGRSVIALDIIMDEIQTLTEEMAAGNVVQMILLCKHGVVVAHSDKNELGKNYFEEKSELASAIEKNVFIEKKDYFDFHSLGGDYLVYAVPLKNGWYSISIIDSAEAYRPLRIISLITAVCTLFVLTALVFIIVKYVKQGIATKRLNRQLFSSADMYMSLCDLDVINNTVSEIKNVNPAISQAVANCGNHMQEAFFGIMKGLPESPTKQAAIEFADLSTIDERFERSNVLTLEYISYGNIWVRARYVVSERTSDGKISHVLWMLENIDQEKKDRENLINMSERALAASEAKSSFLSNMSHEIRTPINAILGMNEMVLRECSDENIIGYSQNIRIAGNTLLGLINDILDFSKIEAGKIEIIPADYDMAVVLNDLVNMIRPRAEAKGLVFVADFDGEIPRYLFGDEIRLKQIITNILTNAVKYTNEGRVAFDVHYQKIENEPDSILLKVAVRDTGIGIKKEDIARLFDKFERVDENRNRSIEGTGLGLSITQSLLTMMGSTLKVESVYGKGSVFSFELKQTVRDWKPIGDYNETVRKTLNDQKKYEASFTAPDAKVIIIDDTSMNLLVFKSLLKKTQIQIDTAQSGDEGLYLCDREKYDIIFLDHMMPRKDGIETLRELKAKKDGPNYNTPVICLTANAIYGAREHYLETGFNDYLTKPIDPSMLEDMIHRYLPEEKVIISQA